MKALRPRKTRNVKLVAKIKRRELAISLARCCGDAGVGVRCCGHVTR